MGKNLKIFRNQKSAIHLKPLNFGMNIDFVVTQSLKIITVHSQQSEETCVPGIHNDHFFLREFCSGVRIKRMKKNCFICGDEYQREN